MMNTTADSNLKCPRCGAALAPDAPQGLCPRCLIAMNAGLADEATQTAAPPPTPGPGQPAPTTGPPAPAADPLAPAEIARHFPQLEILAELGRGGMGVVYKACQKQLDRLVALKVLPPGVAQDPHFAERFQREARAMARLNHPNIVTVHDFGESGGLFYLIMEFVDGMNLHQLEQSRRLTPAEALSIIPKICEALQYAHEEGVVHRDIKPANILVDKRGRVKIADFGLAKLLGQKAADTQLTRSDLFIGTPNYMAPEQMEKPLAVDHRVDIYSLGVVFYEMLTGELPMGHFEPPSRRVQLDVRLDEVVLHALEKDPERRYQHAGDVKTDVEIIAQSRPPPAAARGPVWSRVPAAAAIIAVGSLLAFGIWAFGKRLPGGVGSAAIPTPPSHFTCTTKNGSMTIAKYTGPGGAVSIPGTINGLPVTTIGKGAFSGRSDIFSVIISSSVKSIEYTAFFDCGGLTNIVIGNGVTTIGNQSFASCGRLEGVTIPSNVTSIESGAFWDCFSLTNIAIPASVTSIGDNPFAGCRKQFWIKVDEKNPAYCNGADGILFNKGKTRLISYPVGKTESSYTIPESVTNIGKWTFRRCVGLTSVTIPNLVTIIGDWVFADCTSLTNVAIPGSVNSIENGAFLGCRALTSFVLSKSVTNIGIGTFVGCRGLNSFVVDAANPAYSSSADGVLFNKDKTCLVSYPGGKAGSHEIADSVTKIGDEAFRECPYLTSVMIPESVASIGSAAFRNCDDLTAVYFKGDAPRLDRDVFEGTRNAKIYYRPGAKGWGMQFGGRPTAPWNP